MLQLFSPPSPTNHLSSSLVPASLLGPREDEGAAQSSRSPDERVVIEVRELVVATTSDRAVVSPHAARHLQAHVSVCACVCAIVRLDECVFSHDVSCRMQQLPTHLPHARKRKPQLEIFDGEHQLVLKRCARQHRGCEQRFQTVADAKAANLARARAIVFQRACVRGVCVRALGAPLLR